MPRKETKQEAWLVDEIFRLYNEFLGRPEEFENSDEVDALLLAAEEMTEEIVSSYRQRGRRR